MKLVDINFDGISDAPRCELQGKKSHINLWHQVRIGIFGERWPGHLWFDIREVAVAAKHKAGTEPRA